MLDWLRSEYKQRTQRLKSEETSSLWLWLGSLLGGQTAQHRSPRGLSQSPGSIFLLSQPSLHPDPLGTQCTTGLGTNTSPPSANGHSSPASVDLLLRLVIESSPWPTGPRLAHHQMITDPGHPVSNSPITPPEEIHSPADESGLGDNHFSLEWSKILKNSVESGMDRKWVKQTGKQTFILWQNVDK